MNPSTQISNMSDDRRPTGFAAMQPEKLRQVAQQGGRTAHARGVAHRFTSAEARAAGRRSGERRRARLQAEFAARQSEVTE